MPIFDERNTESTMLEMYVVRPRTRTSKEAHRPAGSVSPNTLKNTARWAVLFQVLGSALPVGRCSSSHNAKHTAQRAVQRPSLGIALPVGRCSSKCWVLHRPLGGVPFSCARRPHRLCTMMSLNLSAYPQTKTDRDREAGMHTDSHTRQTETDRPTDRDRQTETDRQRQTERQTDGGRQTDRQTDR